MPPHPNLLKLWGLTPAELSQIVGENPSMRGLIFGFVAEYKLKAAWLGRPGISNLFRPRSHDRKKKGDFQFSYRGRSVTIEVKCLDTPKVRRDGATWTGTFQCNASDTTPVVLPDGSSLVTNCLPVGGFDVLAVCLHAFGGDWRFGFARNADLPRTAYARYTAAQQALLLKSSMRITWPLAPPFEENLFAVLDRLP